MNARWEGIFAALWTPTDGEGGVLRAELAANLHFLRQHRINGLLVLGSTGEFLLLTPDQRKAMLEAAMANAGDLVVLANISDIRPRVVAEMARFAKSQGCAGVAIMAPPFYRVTQADLLEFFLRAGEAADLPVLLYNFPERTGNRIELETVAAVAERLPLHGIKHSGDDFAYHAPLVKLGREKNFSVLTGGDTRLPEAMALGVAGCIGGLINVVPDVMVEIFDAVKAGVPERSAVAAARMKELGSRIGTVSFPLNVAAAMEARGLPVGQPKTLVSQTTRESYHKLVTDLRQLFREWKLN